ncbi:MAG: GNAT family N-acetyltransferase [Muribaculum sp.]|nr:GNAT family N-acetyltransferase [Muribaculum sp.]
MKKKDAIRNMWKECFNDSDQYVDMFFSTVYSDADALTLEHDGNVVSSMLLQRYAMNFHGTTCSISYICGAATLKRWRGMGFMGELMRRAIRESFERGDLLCALIPAGQSLYKFYEKFGFSPIFYVDIEHYSSAHNFRHDAYYQLVPDVSQEKVYDFFDTMMRRRPCAVQHSRQQYEQILMDNSASGGTVIALADSDGNIAALGFAAPIEGEPTVMDILASSPDAEEALLDEIHKEFSGDPLTVYGYYGARDYNLDPRGMGRIVNMNECTKILAQAYPKLNLAIRIHDNIIRENNHIYIIDGGRAVINDGYGGRLDYDIDIEVFTSMVFGNEVTRRLLDFPAVRPFISLMLD